MNNKFKLRIKRNSAQYILIFLLAIITLLALSSVYSNSNNNELEVATTSQTSSQEKFYKCKIVNSYPHDENAFTQGFAIENNYFYEGTGLYGESTLRKVQIENGKVIQILNLTEKYFGEGITLYQDKIIQVTWRNNVGFVYEKNSFDKLQEFHYPTEGWGITYDGEHLILSDGTSTLHFIDPETYETLSQIQVFSEKGQVNDLNELEYVKGEVYANIWQTNLVARIDPTTGKITGWIDLTELMKIESSNPASIPNGIAYDPKSDRLFVTGKLWSKVFQIELTPIN
ncbi:glutaminyl-peptide cyclotransferase [[Eubacterium] cellulosolvens]